MNGKSGYKKILVAAALVIIVVCTLGSAHADLIDNGGGLIYDTDLDITWYDNPNYVTHVYGDYAAWAADLEVEGATDWRLPTTPGTTIGYTSEGEMGHLFYTELGNSPGSFSNKGPFTNLSEAFYTSTTHDGYNFYCFHFDIGWQYLADINYYYGTINGLAVHDGNIGSPVPLPPTVLLLGSGLLSLAGWRRFRKS